MPHTQDDLANFYFSEELRAISAQDLAAVGEGAFAYVKQTLLNDEQVFAIHAADGRVLGYAANRNEALFAIRENEMLPMTVH